MKLSRILTSALLLTATAGFLIGQASPPKEASVDINGKKITIKYSAPSVRGRQIFGPGGLISKDPTYPVWRAGANSATAFHTDADLTIGNLNVPAGNYTLFVALENPWKLVVNKETGQWGLSYHADKDLGRVPMTMSKPASPVETYKVTLASAGGNKGKLTLEWADVVASVDFAVK
jgi:hypothetical protein